MRTSKLHVVLAAVAAVGIGCPGPDDTTAPVTEWEAVLSSADVIPALTTPTSATATAAFALASGTTVNWTVTIGTAPASAITNIVLAQANAGATITATATQISLATSCTSPCTGSVTLTEAQLNTLRGFGFNLTIRTTTPPYNGTQGEIRGQVRIVPPGS